MLKSHNTLSLAQELIRSASVTPRDDGALDKLQFTLESLGFNCWRLPFSETGTETVDNLFARIGTSSPNFCFAGHTDVVPEGDFQSWSYPPFKAEIIDNYLHGRGAVDMKGAIAAFVASTARYLEKNNNSFSSGSISFLITGDEEGPSINGTQKILKWMDANGQKIDACLVGEPTNPKEIGDMVKIGRRGSMNVSISIEGTQGHVAYPHLADNPLPKLIEILNCLTTIHLDDGSEYFQPSNIEITNIDVGNSATNVIPARAKAMFNVRYNDLHTGKTLEQLFKKNFDTITKNYTMKVHITGESFITPPGKLSTIIADSIEEVTGRVPDLSTTGGTSDARFIKDFCPVAEFGLISQTMHKVNEKVLLTDLELLTEIYFNIIDRYFRK